MKKIIIYQAFTRLFGNKNKTNIHSGTIDQNGCGKFNDFTHNALDALKELGTTHIWFTGILEHATQTAYPSQHIEASPAEIVKGKAGSPYAIRDYYDVCPDLAEEVGNRMKEFESLVQRTHEAGLKAIIDFVPNHVSRLYRSDQKPRGIFCLGEHDNQSEAFSAKNNYYYIPGQPLRLPHVEEPQRRGQFYEFPAKVTGNDCFTASPAMTDWYETVKLNYGVDYKSDGTKHFIPIPNTWYKMLEILLFWSHKNVDGFRCDMAEMVPVEFWEWCIPQIKVKYPGVIFIAEIYKPENYRDFIHQGKFDYLYDKVGLYDTLRGIIEKRLTASEITRCWQNVDDIKGHMLNFLENHDEQRIASRFFAENPFAAIPALVVSCCLHKNPFMLFFAQELGETASGSEGFSGDDGRTTIFDYWGIESQQAWMNDGAFDGKKLTEEQKKLRNYYIDILTLSTQEAALTDGSFYDLQFANYTNPGYDDFSIFSFFRYNATELLFFICNFSESEKEVLVNIPDDARHLSGLDHLDPIRGEKRSILSGLSLFEYPAREFYGIKHQVNGYDAVVLKITKQNT